MSNQEMAKILLEMSELLAMDEVLFKPQAYERAAESIASFSEDIGVLYTQGGTKALRTIPGVGQGIAEKIEEYVRTGHVREYERMKKKLPVDIAGLAQIEGIGPKAIKVLWEKLQVRDVPSLERAARAGKIAKLERFGKKSEEKILKALEFMSKGGRRFRLGDVAPYVRKLEAELKSLKTVDELIVAGSYRRWKETVGDVDILVVSKKPREVMNYFVKMPDVVHITAHGETKSMVKMKNGLDVDVRVVPADSFGAALNYFTGSKEHNVALREIAARKGWKLNEYGLFKGAERIAGKTEEEVYKKLGLRYIEPEMRENTGEIEASRRNELPDLIGYGDLRGDLQIQTDWTDGTHSITEMALAAAQYGLGYIVITDHTKTLAMTGGSDEKKLLRQMTEIDRVNEDLRKKSVKLRVLKGAEVNIMSDGSLDIKDEVLAKLDCVGAAVHSHFKLPRKEQTARVIRAMENPNVDVIFHLTGRIINKREPIDFDFDAIVQAARKTGTILEIDAYPDRLDLRDEHIRKAREAGVKFSIDSDAHAKNQFAVLEYGIAQARRGWCEKKDVINTLSAGKMLQQLK
ncbi:MAG: DNA polymerase/3'-5' exonuclease PolX [Candidatus Sungbacteria bacterium]|nr:DNA polymerase/3'-5' exonuclease PolX [Candidatus Sungbacteria bacterium]